MPVLYQNGLTLIFKKRRTIAHLGDSSFIRWKISTKLVFGLIVYCTAK